VYVASVDSADSVLDPYIMHCLSALATDRKSTR
jgi:hypothetical protein